MVTRGPLNQGFSVGLLATVQRLSIIAKFWQNHDYRGLAPQGVCRGWKG